MLRLGIISYLPDDKVKRELRKAEITKALTRVKDLLPNSTPIHIVSQNYEESDYLEGIEYINFEKPLGPSGARNELLKDFYNSSDDYMIYIDDDTFAYDKYNIKDLLSEWHNNSDKFKMIDICCGISCRLAPYTKENAELDLDNFYHFKKMPFQSFGAFMIIKNLKKYNKELVWYDESISQGEDLDFRIKLEQRNDLFCYCCNNIISKAYADSIELSVCWDATSEEDYWKQQAECSLKLKSKYKVTRWVARWKPGQNILRIPRSDNCIHHNN